MQGRMELSDFVGSNVGKYRPTQIRLGVRVLSGFFLIALGFLVFEFPVSVSFSFAS